MEFRVLGPLEVRCGPEVVVIGSRLERALLTALLLDANRVVSSTRLVEALWGHHPPPSERNSLQTYVARLRRRLGGHGSPIVTRPPGYLLTVDPRDLDSLWFEELLEQAHRTDEPARVLELLDEALGLWRGPAYAEFAEVGVARAEAARVEELRQQATEERADVLLALGRAGEAIGELEAMTTADPVRERPHAQLMGALSRSGRQVEALRLYQRYRHRLDELGLEPSAALRKLQSDVLRQVPSASPPLPYQTVRSGNLPAPATSFVGRGREVAELVAVLGRARQVTLVGTGGVGKTRLALRVADEVADSYPDGAWVVELAPVSSPGAVAHAVAAALGMLQPSGRSIDDALAEFLRSRRLLLLIDNCEHVLGAAAVLVERLLRRCPKLTVLATSRERLAIDGEQAWPVPPLPVPARTAREPGAVREAAAVALFTDRARAARPEFSLDDDAAPAVAEICRGLDGLPLAIELAAARVPALTVGDLAEHLSQRFTVLTAVRRTETERHRTLRAVVDWSYGLLDEPQRRVFERLSVFSGGWTMRDATSVCSVDDEPAPQQTVEIVASLAEKSMVVAPPPGGQSRYALLETLRQYGAERLQARGDAERVGLAHAEHFLALAEQADLGLRGADEGAWVQRLGADLDNLRAAHVWCRDRRVADLALRFSAALHRFACWQDNDEIFTWAAAAAELPAARGHPLLPTVLGSAGVGAWRRGDLAGAVEYAERGLAASAGVDHPSRALPFEVLADVHSFSGRLDDAFDAYAEAARLGRRAGDEQAVSYRIAGQALARAYLGDLRAALALADDLRRIARATHNPTAQAWALYTRGETLLDDDPGQALDLLDESLTVARAVGNVFVTGVALLSATSLQGRHGDPIRALRSYTEAIEHWHQHGNWTQQWITLRNLIPLLSRVGADEPAAVLYGATTASATAPPTFGAEAQRLAAVVGTLTADLGREAFDKATRRGASLSGDEVVGLAVSSIACILAAETEDREQGAE